MGKQKTFIEKLFENKILLALFMLAICGPYLLTREVASIKVLYEFVTMVGSWTIIFLYVRYGKITVAVKWLLLYLGWTFVTTFFLSHNTLSFFQVFLPITAMALLIELAFQYKGYQLLDMAAVFRVYIYVNFILIILFRGGITGPDRWLLGYRNIQSWTLLPVATLLIVRALWKFGKIDWLTKLDLVTTLITLVIIKSATSWIGTFVYIVVAGIAWICYKSKKKMPRIINLFDGFIISVIFFVGIIICRFQYIFEPFIVNVLHKDITFTGRTEIWNIVIEYIKKHWLTGAGYLTKADFKNLFPSDLFNYTHPHNYVLSLLLQGGIILLIIVILGIAISGICLWRHRDNIAANLFLALLLSMLVMGLTEALSVYMCPMMYPMLTMSMHMEEIEALISKKKEQIL